MRALPRWAFVKSKGVGSPLPGRQRGPGIGGRGAQHGRDKTGRRRADAKLYRDGDRVDTPGQACHAARSVRGNPAQEKRATFLDNE